MSKLRVRDSQKKDLVTVDMDTGAVEIAAGVDLTEAAQTWWDAVTTVHMLMAKRLGKAYQDAIMASAGVEAGDGDIIFKPGKGADCNGKGGHVEIAGDVTVKPDWEISAEETQRDGG